MTKLKRNQSLETLSPPHDSSLRKSSLTVAIFNLFSTICGGGVLSLPLAFSVAGIIPTVLVMMFAAYINEFGLYILCVCARRTGGKTYMDVTRAAYGIKAEILTTLVLIIDLPFMLMAYMVLAGDIWTPFALFLCPPLKSYVSNKLNAAATNEDITREASHYVLIFILCLISPLLLKKDLYALRHACYVGFSSLLILTIALVYKAFEENLILNPERFEQEVKWWSWNISDWIFIFPIVGLSFICSYNVLSIQTSLIDPTRNRVRFVLVASNLLCLCFFLIVGISGYLTAYSETQGNIFLNFQFSDKVMLLGRLGYGITIVFVIPVVVLPCREALLSLPEQLGQLVAEINQSKQPTVYNVDEEIPLKIAVGENGSNLTIYSNENTIGTAESKNLSSLQSNDEELSIKMTSFLHFSSTLLIITICYYGAVAVPGVAILWSIVGSSMSIILAFILPTICYIKIRAHKGYTLRMVGSWMLLVFSVVAACVCTKLTLMNL